MPPLRDMEEKKDPDPTLQQQIDELRSALATARAGMPLSLTPEHGGGPGMELAESWGQADQEAARRE